MSDSYDSDPYMDIDIPGSSESLDSSSREFINSEEALSVLNSSSRSSTRSSDPSFNIDGYESYQSGISEHESSNEDEPQNLPNIQLLNEVIHTSESIQSTERNQQPTGSQKTTNNDIDLKQNVTLNVEDEAFSCPICLEGLTNMGSHKPVCLKCGHIFGESCIQRWIKVGCNRDARRCPTCNTKACLKDIRILYAKKLIAIDRAELTALELKLEKENREKNILKMNLDTFKVKNQSLCAEVKKLKTIIEILNNNQPIKASGPTYSRRCLKKINLCKTPSCRVMAFNKHNMLLVVSQHSESPLFNSHVIRKINASLLEPSKECIYAHKKQIRDMTFHPIEHNLLASVSLDKCINLIDLMSNTVVSSIEVDEPLWSCCWAGDNSNMMIAGSQTGSLYYVDRRFMKLLNSEHLRKPACVSLVSLPPSNCRSFLNGGFLKSRMDFISVFEPDSGQNTSIYKETELPLKGLWSSTSYDSQSNLILSSAKPCGANKSIRHIVSKISDFNEHGSRGSLIHPVVCFYGGDMATQLSRSCLIPSNEDCEDTLVCGYDEKSNQVKLFSVNSCSNVHNFYVKDKFLDFCHLNGIVTNDRRTLAGLSENAISIFTV